MGIFPANAFGLYDMHGNVWEWCQDDWHGNYNNAPTDGTAWLSEDMIDNKILRGGSWGIRPYECLSASRFLGNPGGIINIFGFRVVCELPRTMEN